LDSEKIFFHTLDAVFFSNGYGGYRELFRSGYGTFQNLPHFLLAPYPIENGFISSLLELDTVDTVNFSEVDTVLSAHLDTVDTVLFYPI